MKKTMRARRKTRHDTATVTGIVIVQVTAFAYSGLGDAVAGIG